MNRGYVTIEDIEELFYTLNFPDWVNFSELLKDQMLYWRVRKPNSVTARLLHEISHYAVKPNWYLNQWYSRNAKRHKEGEIPYISCLCSQLACAYTYDRYEFLEYFDNTFGDDYTPDEWGSRAWGLMAIEKIGKKIPKDHTKTNPLIWCEFQSRYHIIAWGFDQLNAWGISKDKLRPDDSPTFLCKY